MVLTKTHDGPHSLRWAVHVDDVLMALFRREDDARCFADQCVGAIVTRRPDRPDLRAKQEEDR